ncbi:unnamed protein product [Kuraishia capsulata CBS 1993]|uniref:Alpha/beta hydrolase fold-3 domain-containing protein n=1 Tax=Kuraishia capsulata CBS 1993 TaxID=1382522 RepID=W6MWQ5_9ASCO|nr:uncharacterized protein KUCA_T00003724001 [Kuraishia capsulata CBS 1993]CDK27745.1 unnamed protein product [Kuraishia capsulata CBS 1993]
MVLLSSKIISYGPQKRQVFKHYRLETSRSEYSLVCIHGGAWRDPNNTYADYDILVSKIDKGLDELSGTKNDVLDVYSIDYRLSPEAKHPDHLMDILAALRAIHQKDSKPLVVIGHSVGATLLLQSLTYDSLLPLNETSTPHDSSKEVLTTSLIQNWSNELPTIKIAILADGIFNVQAMLEEYPSYISFVSGAFKSKSDWETKSTCLVTSLSKASKQTLDSLKKIIIVHSTQDELLSLQQPNLFLDWVRANTDTTVATIYEDIGDHENVYRSQRLAKITSEALISE